MIRYIIRRILWLIPVVICVSIVIFTLLYFTPGDPAEAILGNNPTYEDVMRVHAEYGLDDPYIVQLGRFLKQTFLEFDLGTSYVYKNSVMGEFLNRIPRTLVISSVCLLTYVVLAIPLGIIAAVHQNKWQDHLCIFLVMLTTSIPNFWFAMILMLIFSLYLGWLPSFGIGSWLCYIMPCTAAALSGIGGIARQTRSAMLESLSSDYIVTARSKGVSERDIYYKHALPNALIPVITSIGSFFGHSLAGAVTIETVFAIPGVGSYLVNAITARDYPVVRGCVVMLSILFSVVMLIVDLLYAFIDPRIKAQYSEKKPKRRVKDAS